MDILVKKAQNTELFYKGDTDRRLSFTEYGLFVLYKGFKGVVSNYTRDDLKAHREPNKLVLFDLNEKDNHAEEEIEVSQIVPVIHAVFQSSVALSGFANNVDTMLKELYPDTKYIDIDDFISLINSIVNIHGYDSFNNDMLDDLVEKLKQPSNEVSKYIHDLIENSFNVMKDDDYDAL